MMIIPIAIGAAILGVTAFFTLRKPKPKFTAAISPSQFAPAPFAQTQVSPAAVAASQQLLDPSAAEVAQAEAVASAAQEASVQAIQQRETRIAQPVQSRAVTVGPAQDVFFDPGTGLNTGAPSIEQEEADPSFFDVFSDD